MRLPISIAILLATLGSALVTGTNFSVLVRQMVDGANNFSLLSIPFFIVMGEFMSAGGISEKIVYLANLAVCRFRGGLAYVNVLDSMFFGGISGSAVADVSSLGTIVIPMMVKQGYDEDFSVGLTVTTACQGVLIPPSHNMVIYALAAGGGVSIGAHMKGSVVDTQNALDGEGPFSPERSGSLPTGQLVKQCFSGKYTEGEMHRMLSGRGGLVAYTGSNDMRYLLAQAEHDKKIAGVVDAFHYQIGKEIGAMAAAMCGRVDAVILTGGIAHNEFVVRYIEQHCSFIAPVSVYPGENELESLVANALVVLRGTIVPKVYA